jgi:hypothetical protein
MLARAHARCHEMHLQEAINSVSFAFWCMSDPGIKGSRGQSFPLIFFLSLVDTWVSASRKCWQQSWEERTECSFDLARF